MDDERLEPMDERPIAPALTEHLRGAYNPPPAPPRDEMWAVIQAGLEPRGVAGGATVRSLDEARARRAGMNRAFAWATAAAAVLVIGIGIGRLSVEAPTASMAAEAGARGPSVDLMRAAALDHLGRTESMLTLVRADARDGRVDPAMGEWAKGLLSQTRLLLDSPQGQDPAMRDLLDDLELVLVQIVGATERGGGDDARARSEMNMALQGLEERDVLPRIQAEFPAGFGMSGT